MSDSEVVTVCVVPLCQSSAAVQPCHRFSRFDRRAFPVAGPTVWNALSWLRALKCSTDSFPSSLKKSCFYSPSVFGALDQARSISSDNGGSFSSDFGSFQDLKIGVPSLETSILK